MPQPPGTFHLTSEDGEDRRIVQGADNFWTLSFDTTYGADWTGFSCRSQFRADYRDDDASVLASATCSIVDAGPLSRVIQFYLSAETTNALTTECGLWDAEIYNDAMTFRIVGGKWALWKQVTE